MHTPFFSISRDEGFVVIKFARFTFALEAFRARLFLPTRTFEESV